MHNSSSFSNKQTITSAAASTSETGSVESLRTEAGLRHAFDALMMRFKLASAQERLELLEESIQLDLDASSRRQMLIAVNRYMLAERGELPSNANQLLQLLAKLANNFDLRIKLVEMLPSMLESMKRDQIAQQLVTPLGQLLQSMLGPLLPASARPAFSQELFLKVLRRLELRRHSTPDSFIKLCTLGLYFFPFSWKLRETRADCYIETGAYGASRSDFDRLIDQFPERHEYRIDRSEVLQRLDDYEAALDDIEFYLRHDPNYPEALKRQAELLILTGRALEALKVYERLVELEPHQPEHLVNRAKANEQLDYFEEAAKDLDDALSLDPKHPEARQFRHSLSLRKQGYGMEDDLYSAFNKGDEESFLGEMQIPESRFADIGGLQQVKQHIRETIEYPLKYPELSALYGKSAGGGLLFFGPPGCGKTLLARAAAGECGVQFINVNLATVLDKWVGNSEKAISMIFGLARKKVPSIIFLDEVDAIGGSRANMQAGWEKKLISQLLIELDGLNSDNRNVMVLGASNAPWEVDFALRRPGRLGRLVFVPPPDQAARSEIFRIYLERKPYRESEIDVVALARLTDDYSADALRQVVENAAAIPWRQAIETGEERAISQSDLLQAIHETPPDLAEWRKLVGRYEEFAKQSQTRSTLGFRKSAQPQANSAS
jgi:SpoVK/Ycf46/Vps4 family AAA+-type ATPase